MSTDSNMQNPSAPQPEQPTGADIPPEQIPMNGFRLADPVNTKIDKENLAREAKAAKELASEVVEPKPAKETRGQKAEREALEAKEKVDLAAERKAKAGK